VLLFYAIPLKDQNPNFDAGILLFIIIATGIVMTIGMIINSKKATKPVVGNSESVFEFDKYPVPQRLRSESNEK
jgi:hypothetical protein